eukprot:5740609-Prymnesium_polylepis.1
MYRGGRGGIGVGPEHGGWIWREGAHLRTDGNNRKYVRWLRTTALVVIAAAIIALVLSIRVAIANEFDQLVLFDPPSRIDLGLVRKLLRLFERKSRE